MNPYCVTTVCSILLIMISGTVRSAVNDPLSSDTYISAYMDSKYSTTERPVGVVYPETDSYGAPDEPSRSYAFPEYHRGSVRPYGLQPHYQHQGIPPFGHPINHQPPYYPNSHFGEPISPYYHNPQLYAPPFPLFLPDKFTIITKIGGFFVSIVKLFVKALVLKLILKLFITVVMFFILPKLSLLTESENASADKIDSDDEIMDQVSNTTSFDIRGYNKTNINDLTRFVLDSVDGRQFSNETKCVKTEMKVFCRIRKMLNNLDKNLSITRLFDMIRIHDMKHDAPKSSLQ